MAKNSTTVFVTKVSDRKTPPMRPIVVGYTNKPDTSKVPKFTGTNDVQIKPPKFFSNK